MVGTVVCSQLAPVVIGVNSSSADGGLPSTFGAHAAVIGDWAVGSGAPNPLSESSQLAVSRRGRASATGVVVGLPMFCTVTSVR